MGSVNPMMAFRADPKTERLIESERERLVEQANGTPVTQATAIRSLICKTSTTVEQPAG